MCAQGPPPGFAGPSEQQAQAPNGSASSFPSFSSESSFMSAAQEALTAATSGPVPGPAARKPNGSAQWDLPPPAASSGGGSGNIWGTDNNVSCILTALASMHVGLLQIMTEAVDRGTGTLGRIWRKA